MSARDVTLAQERDAGSKKRTPQTRQLSAISALIGLLFVISSLLTSCSQGPADWGPPQPTVALPEFSVPGLAEPSGFKSYLSANHYPDILSLAVSLSPTDDSTTSEQFLFDAYDDIHKINLYQSTMSGKAERLADHLPCALYRELAEITRDGRLLACLRGELATNRQSVTIIALEPSPAHEIGRIILPKAAISLSWSPDGRTLAVATSLNHRAGAVQLYTSDGAQTTYTPRELLVFPPAVLSRHAGDDPGIDGIAWSPDGRYLAFHVSGGITTDYQTLLALSDLGPPDATVDLPVPAGALTVPAVTITHLQDLAAPPRQRLLVWAPRSDALLFLANEATLARLDITSGRLTNILELPDPPATVRGKIGAFATFPADDRVVFVYSAPWNALPSERVYVYTPAA